MCLCIIVYNSRLWKMLVLRFFSVVSFYVSELHLELNRASRRREDIRKTAKERVNLGSLRIQTYFTVTARYRNLCIVVHV